eukprot:jgi/Ulvmu1/11315/UM074_0030.1
MHHSMHNSMHAASFLSSSLPPGSLRGSMHGPPLMAGTALNGSASLSAVDISKAPADVDPTELKALRNRVNRADGGIGRKLTLDVLKLQFGKGLKEAAECLACARQLSSVRAGGSVSSGGRARRKLPRRCSLKPRRRSARWPPQFPPALCRSSAAAALGGGTLSLPGSMPGGSWGAEGDREDRAGAAMEVNGGDVDGGVDLGRTCS